MAADSSDGSAFLHDSANGRSSLTGDATNGAVVYADNCAGCHGADAIGGTERGILGESDEETAEIVLKGEESMPSFADSLSDQDIADVLAWLGEQG